MKIFGRKIGLGFNKKLFLAFLLSLAISSMLYGNSVGGKFIYDDSYFANRGELKTPGHLLKLWLEPYLVSNPDAGTYRPFAIFSFSINFILFGNSPASFHIVNIVLNAIAVFLVFVLVLKLFNNRNLAIFTSLLFAFLPIHTEAVASIKSRDEILATILILLAWLLFIRSTEDRTNYKGIIGSSLLFFLSVLSKETFILTPFMFFILLWIRQKPGTKQLAIAGLLFIPVYLVYFLMRIKALGMYSFGTSQDDFVTNPLLRANVWERIWTPLKVIFIYISKIFVPYNLSASYHFNQVSLVSNPLHSTQVIWGIIFLAILISSVLIKRTRLTPLGIGSLVFLISYIVISKFIFQSGDLVAERWVYFPSVGLSLAGGFLFNQLHKSAKEVAIFIFVTILTIFGAIIVMRNRVWLTSDSLFSSMVKDSPNSVYGYILLSTLYLHHKPLSELEGWINNAYKIAPDYSLALNLKGLLEWNKGNFGLAEEYFLKAIAVDPLNRVTVEKNLVLLYNTSASFYASKGKYDDTIRQLTKLEKLLPGSWQLYSLLGQAYALKNDNQKALYFYQRALHINPDNADTKKRLKLLNVQ